jgi:hypothetical protein
LKRASSEELVVIFFQDFSSMSLLCRCRAASLSRSISSSLVAARPSPGDFEYRLGITSGGGIVCRTVNFGGAGFPWSISIGVEAFASFGTAFEGGMGLLAANPGGGAMPFGGGGPPTGVASKGPPFAATGVNGFIFATFSCAALHR